MLHNASESFIQYLLLICLKSRNFEVGKMKDNNIPQSFLLREDLPEEDTNIAEKIIKTISDCNHKELFIINDILLVLIQAIRKYT